MKLLVSILLISILNLNCFGQKEDVKFAAFNVVSSGIISSSIACFNKPKGQKLGKTFIQSFWKGCLGGSINYTSKKLIEQSSIHNTYSYVWPARLVHSIGTSIVGNGARNERLFSSFEMDVFFTHLRYDGKMHCQIDPYTLGSAVVFLTKKDFSFNWGISAVTGSIVFDKTLDNISIDNNEVNLTNISGQNYGNTIYRTICSDKFYALLNSPILEEAFMKINPNFKTDVINKLNNIDLKTTDHELIHTFQYSEYSAFNTIYIDKIRLNINKYIYVNPNFGAIYLLSNSKGYSNNQFEKEADNFSF